MSAEIVGFNEGILTVTITGKLTQAELLALQRATAERIKQEGHIRLLIELSNFRGWKPDHWDDLSFQLEHDAYVEKMAIVGERKWKGLALVFAAQGIRKFPIEYFETSDKAKAVDWLIRKEAHQASV